MELTCNIWSEFKLFQLLRDVTGDRKLSSLFPYLNLSVNTIAAHCVCTIAASPHLQNLDGWVGCIQNCIVATRFFSLYMKLYKAKAPSVKALNSYSGTCHNSVSSVGNTARDVWAISVWGIIVATSVIGSKLRDSSSRQPLHEHKSM